MKKGYWIVRAEVTNPEQFKEYTSRTPDALAQYGGKFLVRAGDTTLAEGTCRPRNVVIEFPSYQHALDCWESSAYQQARQYRSNAASFDIVIIEGV